MADKLIYANTRAITKEVGLFSKERLARMIESESLPLAVKILYEVGYGGGLVLSAPDLFEEILAEEESRVNTFFSEVNQEGFGLECFILKRDYHNAKALLKAKYMGIAEGFMFLPKGIYPIETLKAIVLEGKKDINPYMQEAVAKLTSLESAPPARSIDISLDKALFKDINNRLAKVKDAAVLQYFTMLADYTNILSFLRTKKIGERAAFLEDCFVVGGKISLQGLVKLLDEDIADIKKAIKYFGYPELEKFTEAENFSAMEAAIDNNLIRIFKEKANDIYSAAPLLNYYLQKLNEIKMIRIVLVCLKNNTDLEEIYKRMRVIYA